MKVHMRSRTIYFTLFTVLSLVIGACGSPLNEKEAPLQEVLAEAEITEAEITEAEITEAETTEAELPKDSAVQDSLARAGRELQNLWQEQRRSEFAAALIEKLPAETSREEKAAFVEWLLDTYGYEQLKTIDFSEDINRQLYDVTGASLHVLWDTSLGYLEDEETAAAHSIYLRDTEGTVVDLAFAGDICLTEDGYVIDHYDAVGDDINLCLSKEIMDRLNEADISMINHEYPVSTRGTALKGKYYTFRANPEREIILQQMGIDIVSLANNHIYDFGADAFYDTLEVLKEADLPYVGAGADIEEASRPVYFIVGGIKIGFVSANRSEKIIYTPEAGENSPGVVRMYDTAMMNDIIKDASGQCDYLIAYVHWGTEDSKYFESYQTAIAREFFDSGADAIIGSHPHVLQGIGYVDGKPVVYSLGDFWFNRETKYTAIVNLEVTIDGISELSVLPCIQEGYETHYIGDALGQEAFYEYLRTLSPEAEIDDDGIITDRQP
ncbi:MAG: CapA family protein [Lachnospiraceae bacterium]|nr:CapA family protein [Lachnospiraceae bacterium]